MLLSNAVTIAAINLGKYSSCVMCICSILNNCGDSTVGFSAIVAPIAARMLAMLKYRVGSTDAHVAIKVNMAQVGSAMLFQIMTVFVILKYIANLQPFRNSWLQCSQSLSLTVLCFYVDSAHLHFLPLDGPHAETCLRYYLEFAPNLKSLMMAWGIGMRYAVLVGVMM